MSAKSGFRVASERLELALNVVALIAEGQPLDSAAALLESLQRDEMQYGDTIRRVLDRLAALSDGPIKWKAGRGLSGFVRRPDAVFPHVWSSAHQAALEISRLALEHFWWPLEGITDAAEQQATFRKLLSKSRRKAMAMTMGEVAGLQERIRRERAKLLRSIRAGRKPAATLLDRTLAVLTPNQGRILKYLWDKGTASYNTLQTIPSAFRDVPSPEAITAALKKIRTRLNQHNLPLTLRISDASSRVNLDRLEQSAR